MIQAAALRQRRVSLSTSSEKELGRKIEAGKCAYTQSAGTFRAIFLASKPIAKHDQQAAESEIARQCSQNAGQIRQNALNGDFVYVDHDNDDGDRDHDGAKDPKHRTESTLPAR